jgi:heme/copper-type cytochrome/quinol oxidase subunit 2
MPAHVVAVDAVAILFVVAGAMMVFRQRLVRSWARAWRDRDGAVRAIRPARPEGEDPVHYALIIFGMMLLAFGLVLFAFTTFYWRLTAGGG